MKTSIRKEQGGIPKGGTTNEALEKASNADYDVQYAPVSGGGGDNSISLVAGNTFDASASPRAFTVLEGNRVIMTGGSATFNQNFGDQLSNQKYCYQLNVAEGQSVNIDTIKIVSIQGQGTPSDNLTLSIQGNSANAPDGTPIQSSTIPGFSGLQTVSFPFTPFELNAPAGGGDKNYFVVLERTGSVDPVNYYIISLGNTGGTNQSAYRYNGSTLAWVNSDLKICSQIEFTYLDGVAYLSTRGLASTTKSANGTSGTVPNGTRIFAFDVGSSGGGWRTDAGFVTDGDDIARIRGFLSDSASIGDPVVGAIAGGVAGFTGLTPGEDYILARNDAGGITQGTTASDIEAGQSLTSTEIVIRRVNG